MKKVIALALAVLMLATVALAVGADVKPGATLKIGRFLNVNPTGGSGTRPVGIRDQGGVTVYATPENGTEYKVTDENGDKDVDVSELLLRSVNSGNYSLASVKYVNKAGKNLIEKVWIDDSDDCVKIKLKDDLTNTSVKDFEVSFKLKGKTKYTIRTDSEWDALMTYGNYTGNDTGIGTKVSLPDVNFKVVGTVGYGKVEVDVYSDDTDEIDGLESITLTPYNNTTATGIDIYKDVVKFVARTGTDHRRVAGAYTADAILTQEYGDDLTLEARVYSNDTLYFYVDNDPDDPVVQSLADVTADIDFFYFTSDASFVRFNSNAKLYFENADEDCYVYQVKNNKLFPFGEYVEDEGCWVGEARTLGQYVVSSEPLTQLEGSAADDPGNANPDTGANDVVGIATALAAVALVSAAAVSLKK